ncbi:sulfurtransferase TusA family protein [Algicella marina]|uniref:Preprotein translocase subunit TatB n=1 Tax=Algicella marina TaxID=2683284 RepID=A0A6P1SZE1_9RHOB|nr:sulfurtransferase TusA family protein [Algicella marina]QHQ34586.1 preprotein translocase subunit TatB [Algicella marina]
MSDSDHLDARGLLCPLPVLKIRKRLKAAAVGSLLEVETDDPAALIDVPHFCAEQGHEIVSSDEVVFPHQRWMIRKG